MKMIFISAILVSMVCIPLLVVDSLWAAECLQFRSIVNAGKIQECFDLLIVEDNENDDLKHYNVEHFIYWASDPCKLTKTHKGTWPIVFTKKELTQITQYCGEPLESELWNVVKRIMIQAKVDPTGKTPVPFDFTN